MRRVPKLLPLVIIVVLSLCFLSCEGDQGPVGPEGEKGDVGTPGEDGSPGPKGDAGLVWKGPWASQGYNKDEAVEYQGSAYVCILTHSTPQTPPNATYWNLLAQGGMWNGGTVTNPAMFSPSAPATFQALATFEDQAVLQGVGIIRFNDANGNRMLYLNQDHINIYNPVSGVRHAIFSDGDLKFTNGTNGNDYTVELDGGLWGRLELRHGDINGKRVDISAYQDGGKIILYNAARTRTIELDAETGNIYYSGSLVPIP